MNVSPTMVFESGRRKSICILIVLVLVGVGLSVVAALTAWRIAQFDARTKFNAEAQDRFAVIAAELEAQVQLMDACRAFYAGRKTVGEAEFQNFARYMLRRVHSVSALVWVPCVPAAQRHEVEAGAGIEFKELGSSGALVKAAPRAEYFPILFVTPPLDGRLAGYDMASSEPRKATMADARKSGEITASPRLTFLDQTLGKEGFLLMAPIFEDDGAAADRRPADHKLNGYVVAVMQLSNVFAAALQNFQPIGLAMEVNDNSPNRGGVSLFRYSDSPRPGGGEILEWFEKRFQFAGRQWSVRCGPMAGERPAGSRVVPGILLAAGLTTTGLMAALLGSVFRQSWWVEQLVYYRTSLLQKANRELKQEIQARTAAEQKLAASLSEKELLLREIHHRVRNNLQFICSLIHLEAGHFTDPEAARLSNEMRSRVRSIALIYEKLQADNPAMIDFDEYVRNLSEEIFRTHRCGSREIAIQFQMEKTLLNLDTAIPCGLIVNELLTNAVRHAFPRPTTPAGEANTVTITLHALDEDQHVLAVQDNGVGLPPHFGLYSTATLGLQTVVLLVEQLNGKIMLEEQHGTHFIITFRELHYRART